MKVAVVRGAFLNQFEMQSFAPLAKRHKIVAFSSLKPIHEKVAIPIVKLFSPIDLLTANSTLKCNGVRRICRGLLNRAFVDAHFLFGLEKCLKNFDIAHCAETYFHYTKQCLEAKKKGWVRKVICSVSETIPFNNEGILGRAGFKKRAREEVDLFLARTKLAKEALIKEGCDPGKIIVIPHGVDLNKFKVQSSKLKAKEEPLLVLFVGRLEEEKGVKELLKAYRKLVSKIKNLRLKLKIVGKGSLRKWTEQWIKKNKQDDNITIGQYAYHKMPKVYQEADIFVLPSKRTKNWQEHFGMALVEAMASSLPIVATSSGAIPEILGECGILVEEEDVIGLYKGLKRLVEDGSLRVKLGRMGRQRVEEYFDSQKVAAAIEKVYEEVLTPA